MRPMFGPSGVSMGHIAVVRVMYVAHLEAGAVPRKASGAEGVESALVRKPGEGIHLIHELRKLGGAEESLIASTMGFMETRSGDGWCPSP